MIRHTRHAALIVVAVFALTVATDAVAQVATVPPPAPQNPSPMVEKSRAHGRIPPQEPPGGRRTFNGPLDRTVQLFHSLGAARSAQALRLVVHFHGAAFIPEVSASRLGREYVVATVNLGAGSGVYDRTFSEPATYDSLLSSIKRETAASLGRDVAFRRVVLVGFSAGHGAIRAILRDQRHFNTVDAVLLLDGLHTSYVPEGTVVEKGGTLDTTKLEVFVRYGHAAMRGEKRFLVTHSEIFPGTFASTTETSDYLIEALGLKRAPVLRWGPQGMQQLSEVRNGQLEIMGFAGNSGPDHIDQFHGMPDFLRRIERK